MRDAQIGKRKRTQIQKFLEIRKGGTVECRHLIECFEQFNFKLNCYDVTTLAFKIFQLTGCGKNELKN